MDLGPSRGMGRPEPPDTAVVGPPRAPGGARDDEGSPRRAVRRRAARRRTVGARTPSLSASTPPSVRPAGWGATVEKRPHPPAEVRSFGQMPVVAARARCREGRSSAFVGGGPRRPTRSASRSQPRRGASPCHEHQPARRVPSATAVDAARTTASVGAPSRLISVHVAEG